MTSANESESDAFTGRTGESDSDTSDTESYSTRGSTSPGRTPGISDGVGCIPGSIEGGENEGRENALASGEHSTVVVTRQRNHDTIEALPELNPPRPRQGCQRQLSGSKITSRTGRPSVNTGLARADSATSFSDEERDLQKRLTECANKRPSHAEDGEGGEHKPHRHHHHHKHKKKKKHKKPKLKKTKTILNPLVHRTHTQSLMTSKDKDDDDDSHEALEENENSGPPGSEEFPLVWSNGKLFEHFGRIIKNPHTDNFFLFFILVSSVCLAVELPTDVEGSQKVQILYYLDIVFTVVFTFEFMLKVSVMGFAGSPWSYMSDRWNQLDGTIVAFGLLSLCMTGVDLGAFKAVRFFRVLRPLRVLSKNAGMRTVVNSLLMTLPAIFNVFLAMMLVFIIFGILAVMLFSGTFYSCQLPPDQITALGITTKEECLAAGATWENADQHFDNIFVAILTLFEVSTLEGWVDVMYQAQDAVGVDKQPIQDHIFYAAWFFVVFIFIAAFFLNALFVGVVFDTFRTLRDQYTGFGMLTAEQKLWVETEMLVLRAQPTVRPRPPANKIRRRLWLLVHWKHWDTIIYGTIVMNIMALCVTHQNEPEWLTDAILWTSVSCTAIFTMEAIIKIIGLSFRTYFSIRWNQFEFVIIVGSLIEVLFLGSGMDTSALRSLRIFSVARLIRLVRTIKTLKTLLRILLISLPSLINVGTLLALMYFVFAVLGTKLFGTVPHGRCLGRHANFETFPTAFLTLFRVSTGEDWHCLEHDIIKNGPPGIDATNFASLYFVLFFFLGTYITLNLFIAVILDNFSKLFSSRQHAEDNLAHTDITEDEIREFTEVWSTFDPDATQLIHASKIQGFLSVLGPPLGLAETSRAAMRKFVKDLELPLHPGGNVHFKEVLLILARRFETEIPDNPLQAEIESKFDKKMPVWEKHMTLQAMKSVPGEENDFEKEIIVDLGVYLAVVRAQRVFRMKLRKRQIEAGLIEPDPEYEEQLRASTQHITLGDMQRLMESQVAGLRASISSVDGGAPGPENVRGARIAAGPGARRISLSTGGGPKKMGIADVARLIKVNAEISRISVNSVSSLRYDGTSASATPRESMSLSRNSMSRGRARGSLQPLVRDQPRRSSSLLAAALHHDGGCITPPSRSSNRHHFHRGLFDDTFCGDDEGQEGPEGRPEISRVGRHSSVSYMNTIADNDDDEEKQVEIEGAGEKDDNRDSVTLADLPGSPSKTLTSTLSKKEASPGRTKRNIEPSPKEQKHSIVADLPGSPMRTVRSPQRTTPGGTPGRTPCRRSPMLSRGVSPTLSQMSGTSDDEGSQLVTRAGKQFGSPGRRPATAAASLVGQTAIPMGIQQLEELPSHFPNQSQGERNLVSQGGQRSRPALDRRDSHSAWSGVVTALKAGETGEMDRSWDEPSQPGAGDENDEMVL